MTTKEEGAVEVIARAKRSQEDLPLLKEEEPNKGEVGLGLILIQRTIPEFKGHLHILAGKISRRMEKRKVNKYLLE